MAFGFTAHRLTDLWDGPRADDAPAWPMPHVVFVGDERTKNATDEPTPWVSQVAEAMGGAPVNLGREHASNEWIMAQAVRVIEQHRSPVVVQWTDPGRYLYVDERGRFHDFLKDRKITRGLALLNQAETARRAFYEIDTPGLGLHRLMLNQMMLTELASALSCRVVQLFTFLDDAALEFLAPRVDGVMRLPASALADAVVEKLRC